VSERPVTDLLAARRDLVVLLRLVVEAGGRVIYGEVVDTRRPPRRFVGERGLVAAIRGLRTVGESPVIEAPRARDEPGRVPNKRRRLPARSLGGPAIERRPAPPTGGAADDR